MATDSRSIVWQQNTDAEFRAWITEVIAQLVAIGLTQTADTGQIDTSTVTRSGSANTASGYAIFRFNDAMQATKPIFFKLEFGTGSTTAKPSIWLTIGEGSDGAGTITGSAIRPRLQQNFTGTSNTVPNVACYNASLGMMHAHWSAGHVTSSYLTMMIARTCDETETPDGRGLFNSFGTGTANHALWDFASASTMTNPYLFTLPYSGATSDPDVLTDDGYKVAYACQTHLKNSFGIITFPGILGIHAYHWWPYWEIKATIVETERTFITMPHNGTTYGWDAQGSVYGKLAWIWE